MYVRTVAVSMVTLMSVVLYSYFPFAFTRTAFFIERSYELSVFSLIGMWHCASPCGKYGAVSRGIGPGAGCCRVIGIHPTLSVDYINYVLFMIRHLIRTR